MTVHESVRSDKLAACRYGAAESGSV